MKLRCTNDSIRLRLRKSDISILEQKNSLTEAVCISLNKSFEFILQIKDCLSLSIDSVDAKIIISLPMPIAEKWIMTAQIGIEEYLDFGDNQRLHLLIEKDFPCLDRPTEDKSDTFHELVSHTPENC